MLAGVPLLRTRKHGRGYPSAAQPGSYLAAAAKVAVVLLICTNLAQIYILSSRAGMTCQESQPAVSHQSHQPVMGAREAGRAHTESILAHDPALPAAVLAAEMSPMPFPDRHFAVFIVFSWNFEVFWTSLQTYLAAGWGKRLIIIDNSMDRRIVEDPDVVRLVGEVIPTRVKLTFSQAMNFVSDIAIERNYTYFFWGHADVALLANHANELFAEEVLKCMDRVEEQEDMWGVTFFQYDWFSATRTSVAYEVKYDTFITVYMSDCDYYPRVRAKWKTLNYEDVCPGTKVHVYDMKRALRLPLGDYDATKAILEGDDVDATNRNAWKTQQWSIGEQVGWELWEMTTRQYFRYKWGLPKNGTMDCEVEIKNEDGEKVLRQYPFETVMDMLPKANKAAQAAEAEHARRLF